MYKNKWKALLWLWFWYHSSAGRPTLSPGPWMGLKPTWSEAKQSEVLPLCHECPAKCEKCKLDQV